MLKLAKTKLTCFNIIYHTLVQNASFIILGDWGVGNSNQTDVAKGMEQWAATNKPQFILTTGDNFYQNGITGHDDPRWNSYWRNVYNSTNIKPLPWQVAIGNHGYYPANSGKYVIM